MSDQIIANVVTQLATLPDELQRKVLEFVEALKANSPRGLAGQRLLPFAGFIPPADLQEMRLAIETGFGRIDLNEW